MTPRDVLKEDIKDFQMVDRIHMATEMSASVDTQGGMFEEEYRWPLCNTHAMSPSMTHVPKYVNCKNCLRRMRKA